MYILKKFSEKIDIDDDKFVGDPDALVEIPEEEIK